METKYKPGVRIVIEGQPVKAENGTFEITSTIFHAQPDGDDYWQWCRVMANGKVTTSKATSALRGHRASWLDRNAKVVG